MSTKPTLFQLHAPINKLKSLVPEVATLWQSGDAILLLGETAAYSDWLLAYIDDYNYDEEATTKIDNISTIYVLADDTNSLNKTAMDVLALEEKANKLSKADINKPTITILTDAQWVDLTSSPDAKFARVVTLRSAV